MAANAIKEAMKEHDEGQELDDEFHTQMMKH
jgi:hypothetical protein